MAVGDDWQSIYRFAGSDMSLFTAFEKLFGVTERLYIQTTYRNSQELIDIAGKFVQRNPMQLQKQLRSEKHLSMPIQLIGFQDNIQKAFLYALYEIVKQPQVKSVLLLGRNNYDIQALMGNEAFSFQKTVEGIRIKWRDYPRLDIQFLTVHKSKGLQADEVILINCKNDLLGFPNQMSDDPLLDLVMTEGDYYQYGEERRLFYVALTRTRNHTYLLVPEKKPSPFVNELIKSSNLVMTHVEEAYIPDQRLNCPKCQSGILIQRKGRGRSFLGCSNYPMCDYTIKEMSILKQPIRCNVCGDYMVKRYGKTGYFYGCQNYPRCTHTTPIKQGK